MFDCEFCSKELKSQKGLNVHKSFCKKGITKKFICDFCSKELGTKHSFNLHLNICKQKESIELEKNKAIISTLQNRLDFQEKENNQLKKELDESKNKITLLSTQISYLEKENRNLLKTIEETNRSLNSQANTINTLAQKSGTTNNINQINNYLQPITKEDFEKIKLELIHDHDIVNEKQFARFCLQNGLKNKVVKTDHSRKVITYVDEEGNQIKDPKAKDLTEDIYKSTKTVFEEKAKQYEKFNDEQDRDRLDFYNNIVSVDKSSMEKFSDEIVKEASKKLKDNINPIFLELREHVQKSICIAFNQGTLDIGDWIYRKLKDKIQACRSSVSIKKKYIIIRESKEKIDNKTLKEGIVFAFSVPNFSETLLSQIGKFVEGDLSIEEIIKGCNLVYDKIVNQKDENELDNIIIGMCG